MSIFPSQRHFILVSPGDGVDDLFSIVKERWGFEQNGSWGELASTSSCYISGVDIDEGVSPAWLWVPKNGSNELTGGCVYGKISIAVPQRIRNGILKLQSTRLAVNLQRHHINSGVIELNPHQTVSIWTEP